MATIMSNKISNIYTSCSFEKWFYRFSDSVINKEINKYESNQTKNKTNETAIMILTSNFDPNHAFAIRDNNTLKQVTRPSKYGYILHNRVKSIDEMNNSIKNSSKKIETLIIRGHGMFSPSKNIHKIVLHKTLKKPPKKKGLSLLLSLFSSIFNFLFEYSIIYPSNNKNEKLPTKNQFINSENLSKNITKDTKSIILQSCRSACVYQDKNGKVAGLALDIAHRNPGVKVTGESRRGQVKDSKTYFRSKKTGLIEARFTRPNGEEYSRSFCVDKDKDYESLEALKEAYTNFKENTDKESFKNLLYNTKMSVADLKTFYEDLVKENNEEALTIFRKAPAFPLIEGKDRR